MAEDVARGGPRRRVCFLSQNRPGPRMGMGHYERLLVQYLLKQDTSSRWEFEIVFAGRASGQALSADGALYGLTRAGFLGFSPGRLNSLPWPLPRLLVAIGAPRSGPDLYHSLALDFPAPALQKVVYTIHDLPPARFADEGVLPKWASRAAQGARAIITPSSFAKQEIVELLGVAEDRVHVIPNGCDHSVFNTRVNAADLTLLGRFNIVPPFVVYVGGGTRRKNVRALLAAWPDVLRCHPGLSLAIVGPREQIEGDLASTDNPGVVLVGHLEPPQVAAVVRASELLVCPSIYEGFGLPPLEAMALGVPVVAVRAGAIPEVVGEAAFLVGDGSPDAISAGLHSVLSDSRLSAMLRDAGPARAAAFSWETHARQVLKVYEAILQ